MVNGSWLMEGARGRDFTTKFTKGAKGRENSGAAGGASPSFGDTRGLVPRVKKVG